MTEPDVTLTDYGLAIESALFAYLMLRQGRARALATWGALFFAAGSLGALAGGTVHGFFLDERTLVRGSCGRWPCSPSGCRRLPRGPSAPDSCCRRASHE